MQADIPERTLIRVLKGERDINVLQIAKLAPVFGLYPHEIMDSAEKLIERADRGTVPDLSTTDIDSSVDPADDLEDVEQPQDEANGVAEDGVVTTEEEIAAYRIIKAIACRDVDPERITMRDAKSYCSIFLDDNNRKPVARLFFNTKQKYIGLFDENKNVTRHPIDSLNGIYAFADQIREEVQRLL